MVDPVASARKCVAIVERHLVASGAHVDFRDPVEGLDKAEVAGQVSEEA